MFKKLTRFLAIPLLLVALLMSGCSIVNKDFQVKENYTAEPQILEYHMAYYLVFEELMKYDTALHLNKRYIALDVSDVLLEDSSKLIALVQDYCDANNYILLLGTHLELTEEGYINGLYFPEGVLIHFRYRDYMNRSPNSLEGAKVVTAGTKWASAMGAIGGTYTINHTSDGWELDPNSRGFSWIS